MGAVDIKNLLEPIKAESPSGADLSGDPRTFELKSLAGGKPSRYEGTKEIPAEEPNWVRVREHAEGILKESKDIRVAMHFTRALVKTEGYPGLAAGLSLLHDFTSSFWDSIHPRLDPTENNDPMQRINIFDEINDERGLVRFVRTIPLVASREVGRFSLRDYEIATGKLAAPKGEPVATLAAINACFRSADLNAINDTVVAIQLALDMVDGIEKTWPTKFITQRQLEEVEQSKSESTDDAQAQAVAPSDVSAKTVVKDEVKSLKFEALTKALLGAKQVMESGLKFRSDVEGGSAAGAAVSTPTGTAADSGAGLGLVRTREDCVKAIDLVADYFRKHERSSPIPLILERAKRLMTKDFLEIMQDLAPDGVSQAAKVFGTDPKKA